MHARILHQQKRLIAIQFVCIYGLLVAAAVYASLLRLTCDAGILGQKTPAEESALPGKHRPLPKCPEPHYSKQYLSTDKATMYDFCFTPVYAVSWLPKM